MRRSELLGVRRDSLDLDAGTLTIDETLISVGGRAEESDGKTAAGVRTVSLDAFTIAALRRHLAVLDIEQQAFGPAYPPDGWLFVWPNGQRPHPDTVTDRFNHLVDAAGARRIQLHDVAIRTRRCRSTPASTPKFSVIGLATPTRRSHSGSTPIDQPDGTAPPRNSSAS
jgi:integrase